MCEEDFLIRIFTNTFEDGAYHGGKSLFSLLVGHFFNGQDVKAREGQSCENKNVSGRLTGPAEAIDIGWGLL